MSITEYDLQEWALSPVTQKFLADLRASYEVTKEGWAAEYFVGTSLEQGALQNAVALGGVRVLRELIDKMTEQIEVYTHPEGGENE